MVHVPVRFRSELAGIMRANLTGMARADEHARLLEKGRSKLLYGIPPKGFGPRTELALRLAWWKDSSIQICLVCFVMGAFMILECLIQLACLRHSFYPGLSESSAASMCWIRTCLQPAPSRVASRHPALA